MIQECDGNKLFMSKRDNVVFFLPFLPSNIDFMVWIVNSLILGFEEKISIFLWLHSRSKSNGRKYRRRISISISHPLPLHLLLNPFHGIYHYKRRVKNKFSSGDQVWLENHTSQRPRFLSGKISKGKRRKAGSEERKDQRVDSGWIEGVMKQRNFRDKEEEGIRGNIIKGKREKK